MNWPLLLRHWTSFEMMYILLMYDFDFTLLRNLKFKWWKLSFVGEYISVYIYCSFQSKVYFHITEWSTDGPTELTIVVDGDRSVHDLDICPGDPPHVVSGQVSKQDVSPGVCWSSVTLNDKSVVEPRCDEQFNNISMQSYQLTTGKYTRQLWHTYCEK